MLHDEKENVAPHIRENQEAGKGGNDKCPRCYGKVDPRASICPHCGKRLRTSGQYHLGMLVAALGLLVLIAGIAGGSAGGVLIGLVLLIAGYGMRGD